MLNQNVGDLLRTIERSELIGFDNFIWSHLII